MCLKNYVVHCELLDVVALQDYLDVFHVFFQLEIFGDMTNIMLSMIDFLNSKSIVQKFATISSQGI